MLVIAGLLIAVVAPNFSAAMGSAKMISAAHEIASALRHVRGHALATGQDGLFELNVKEHRYRISGREKTYSLPGEVAFSIFTSEQDQYGEEGGAIRFFPDGSSNGGRVTLRTPQRKLTIDIVWLTGDVVTEEAESDEPG